MGAILTFLFELPLLVAQFFFSSFTDIFYRCILSVLESLTSLLPFPTLSSFIMERVKKLLKIKPQKVTEGKKTDELHFIPVYQRSDGVTVKLGAVVTRSEDTAGSSVMFNVKSILVQSDLQRVLALLIPSECLPQKSPGTMVAEEMSVDINEIIVVKDKSICPDIARNGMENVARSAHNCPFHVQKFIRKHQLSSTMRREVQKFLSGFSMAGSCSLGCVNWQLDPVILGLERDTDFSMEYRVERSVDNISHMDLLMGKLWDVRNISGTDGYRIILTLELLVDSNQELFLKMHATLLSGKVDPGSYRSICLRDTSNLHMLCNRRLSDITNNRTRRLSDITNNASNAVITPGQTLAWDEFQTQSAGNSPFRQSGGSATVSLDDMFALGSAGSLPTFPTASTSAFHTLEKLLSAIPQSQIVFNSPIKEVSGEYTGVSSTVTGPNTSTPADDLDTENHSSATPHSSPSLQDHQKPEQENTGDTVSLDEELESLRLKENKLQVTFAPLNDQEEHQEQRLSPRMMNTSPDQDQDDEEDEEDEEEKENSVNNGIDMENCDEMSNEDVDSMRPSPNISTLDCEEHCSSPDKSEPKTGAQLINSNLTSANLNNVSPLVISSRVSSSSTSTPPKHTSFKRVQDYIQSLPSPKNFTSKPSQVLSAESHHPSNKVNASMTEDDTTSLCSGSHSLLSRQSELSSLTGARMGRGLFYGSSTLGSASNNSAAALCPFPEDWQQSIPECIENDDEVD